MGNYRIWIALLLFSTNIINYMDRVALSVAAKPISTEFGFSPVAMGYLFSSFLWSYIICLIPVGMLVDRLGSKGMMGAGLSIWSAATIFTGSSWNLVSIFTARLFMGVGESTGYPVAARVIREWFPEGERGLATMLFNSGSFAGPAVGAILSGWLVTQFGWRFAFFALGVLGFVWLAIWLARYGAPDQAKWLSAQERDKILSERNGRGVRDASVSAPQSSVLHLLAMPTIWGIVISQAMITYNGYLFMTWLPSYLQSTLHVSTGDAGTFTSIAYVATLIIGLLAAHFSDKLLGPKAVRSGGRRYFVIGGLLFAVLVLAAPHIQSAVALLALISLILAGQNTASSLNLALLNDLTDNPRDASRVMSLAVLGGNLCGAAAPIVTGYVIQATGGYSWAFTIAASLLVVAIVLTFALSHGRIKAQHATFTAAATAAT